MFGWIKLLFAKREPRSEIIKYEVNVPRPLTDKERWRAMEIEHQALARALCAHAEHIHTEFKLPPLPAIPEKRSVPSSSVPQNKSSDDNLLIIGSATAIALSVASTNSHSTSCGSDSSDTSGSCDFGSF